MAADIVPVRLGLTKGDLYTLWAPSWRDADDEWQAFLGKDEDLYGFESVADLAAFVRTNSDHDLADHPAWTNFVEASAHRLDPAEERRHDLIGVPELVAEKPTAESVSQVLRALAIVQAIGLRLRPDRGCRSSSTATPSSARWARVSRRSRAAPAANAGPRSRPSSAATGTVWSTRSTRSSPFQTSTPTHPRRAEAELAEPAPEVEVDDEPADEVVISDEVDTDEEAEALAAVAEDQVLGSDEDFWTHVGIDPIRLLTRGGTYYTLRCYLDDKPIFLGRNGRINVFGSERSLARYLADEHESDLSDLATFDDIKTAATDGSLQIKVSDENVYVLRSLTDDIADGPDTVDRDQLQLAVELIRDVGDYAEDTSVEEALDADQPLGRFIGHVLSPNTIKKPGAPYAKAVEQWETVENFVESRLREE